MSHRTASVRILIVLTLAGDRIAAITRFVDTTIPARFGLADALAADPIASSAGVSPQR